MRDRQLGDLLRTRRDRLRPGDVGLPEGTRRRARGLRREEVAGMAGISTTYYTFLEQGRDVRPSRQVLDALARALRMDTAERAHLHQLVHGETTPAPAAETLDPQVTALVDRLDPNPAYVTGRTWDLLAANRAARLLWTDWRSLPLPDRNMLWWTFTDSAARTVLVEWEAEAAALLGRFRAASARHPGDPAFDALLERLHAASPEVRRWWARHEVTPLSSGVKRLRHPLLGELSLRHLVLQVADDPEQKLVTFTADEAVQERLTVLLRADHHA